MKINHPFSGPHNQIGKDFLTKVYSSGNLANDAQFSKLGNFFKKTTKTWIRFTMLVDFQTRVVFRKTTKMYTLKEHE